MANPILCRGRRHFLVGRWSNDQSSALSTNKKKCPRHPSIGQQGNRDCHFRRGLFDPDEHHGDFPTSLAVLGGAVGVGLGFGLQKIASNFISGVILLLEGQATVGDYVELDGGEAAQLLKPLRAP